MIFQSTFDQINKALILTTSDKVTEVSKVVQTPLTMAITMYVIIYGWMILKGSIEEPISGFMKRLVKIALIWYLIINPTVFMDNFGNVILNVLPNDISQAITGAKPEDNVIDTFVKYGTNVADKINKESGFFDLTPGLLTIVMKIIIYLAGVVAFFMFALSDLVVAMLLIVAPVFICLLMYESTKQWFQGWLSSMITFVLLKILTVSLLTLVNGITEKLTAPARQYIIDWTKLITIGWQVIIVYFIGFFIFTKLYDIAAAIGGGPSMGGFTGHLGAPFRAASSAFSKIRSWAGGGRQNNTGSSEQTKSSNATVTSTSSAGSSGSASAAPASSTASTSNNKATNNNKQTTSITSPEQIQSYTAPISSALSVPSATTTSMSISIGGQPVVYGSEAAKRNSSKPADSTRVRRLTPVANSAGSAAISNPTGNPGTYGMPPSTGSSGNLGSSKTSESSGSPQPPDSTGEKPGSSRSSSSSGSSVIPSVPRSSTKKRENDDEML